MPKRNDLKKILIIGSGPIIISQACEFDYSGTQAIKALKEENIEVVLINSNPATIMTDPEMADHTYIEPITAEVVSQILKKEHPDAILPTLGGQTALNTALEIAETNLLNDLNIEMIGVTPQIIKKAESRDLFRKAMKNIQLKVPKSYICHSLKDCIDVGQKLGFPLVVRPSFTLGGTGGGVAYNTKKLKTISEKGLSSSLNHEVIIEESILGWKEFELEVMRDKKDNVVIICSIENFDPMGIHTGDSITVAPAQTLTDLEFQTMRNAAINIVREIGVTTGGSNVQFAVNPTNGDLMVIEMNPRVSRSSALASKATGFPIAKIATKLALGYTLDELPNDITKKTMASFEPTLDYCVVKTPRWAFEKFPGSKDTLSIAMKSVGESMAIGRNFKEALQKSLRSLETKKNDLFGNDTIFLNQSQKRNLSYKLSIPNSNRIFYIVQAIKQNISLKEIYQLTSIDPWFLSNLKELVDLETKLINHVTWGSLKNTLVDLNKEILRQAKEWGFSDQQIATILNSNENNVRKQRQKLGINPVYKAVDTCAGEFEAYTPYFYSTYEEENESIPSSKKKVLILGSGPNRIGQGIEFDYCCVHASLALADFNIESIMINSNPETVSTDYDTSDKLYFEPLTLEDVLNVIEIENPWGTIVQFGGQTPLNLTIPLEQASIHILGTSPDSIDRAENRKRFCKLINKLKLRQPANETAININSATKIANQIGYPVVIRPSYVLGGRSMEIVYDHESLKRYMTEATQTSPSHPVLIDKFLENAIEVDVDAVSDNKQCIVAGIMEHIEEAGIHSGDSACVLPPHTLNKKIIKEIITTTKILAFELKIKGLMNIQYAVTNNLLYLLEVNPRASRTIPFVSKATGIPWAKIATKVMIGVSLEEQNITKAFLPQHFSVKEAVLPFARFPGVDPILGPEMRSTGEVMGIDYKLGLAFARSQIATGQKMPQKGSVFISVKDADKPLTISLASSFSKLGFKIIATKGTYRALRKEKVPTNIAWKVSEKRPNIIDSIINDEIQLVINTTAGKDPVSDGYLIRRTALEKGIPYITTIAAAKATVSAIKALIQNKHLNVTSLQEYYKKNQNKNSLKSPFSE